MACIYFPADKSYQLSVTTGDRPRAETDADVYCTLVGCYGDTGKKSLSKSNNEQTFRKGQVCVCHAILLFGGGMSLP